MKHKKIKIVRGNKVPRARSIFKSNLLASWACPITLARFMANFFKLINKSCKLGSDWLGLILNFFTDFHLKKKKNREKEKDNLQARIQKGNKANWHLQCYYFLKFLLFPHPYKNKKQKKQWANYFGKARFVEALKPLPS